MVTYLTSIVRTHSMSNFDFKKNQKKPKNSYCVCSPLPPQESALEEMVQQLGVTVGFISKPKVIRDGHAAMCILRPPSAKELSQKEKKKAAAPQPDTVNSTDQTEGKSSA